MHDLFVYSETFCHIVYVKITNTQGWCMLVICVDFGSTVGSIQWPDLIQLHGHRTPKGTTPKNDA